MNESLPLVSALEMQAEGARRCLSAPPKQEAPREDDDTAQP